LQFIDAGVLCDPLLLEYNSLRHSTYPTMSPGAVIIKNNHAWCLTPNSDFKALKTIKW
jgi:hypothetical protein